MKTDERTKMTMMDMDARRIGIDNRCTACISHRKTDFIGDIHKTNQIITGFGGQKHDNISKGTIQWTVNDDNGQEQTFQIPNSYYAPAGGCRLLSPQHWAHEYNKQTGKDAQETTTKENITLYWNNGRNKKTIKLDENGNVGNLYTKQGYNSIQKLYANITMTSQHTDNPKLGNEDPAYQSNNSSKESMVTHQKDRDQVGTSETHKQ